MIMSANAEQHEEEPKAQKTRFGHLSSCLSLLTGDRGRSKASLKRSQLQPEKIPVQPSGAAFTKTDSTDTSTTPNLPHRQALNTPISATQKRKLDQQDAMAQLTQRQTSQDQPQRYTQNGLHTNKATRTRQTAQTPEQNEPLGVFRRRSRQPHPSANSSLNTQKQEPLSQEQYCWQDPSTMSKSTLDLSRAAALAKQIKANGGQLPTPTHQTAPVDQTPVKKRKLPASALVDTEAVKAEVSEHVNAVQRAARNTLAANIEKSGLLADNSSALEASSKIEQMVQDIVDLYVPLFERELRITLENDILDKLSQGTEV